MRTLELSGELSVAIMLQPSNPEFIKTISCVHDRYYISLERTIQLDDVVKMCWDSDNVLCIDTTFNLCSSWVTDFCYNNEHLTKNEGKNQIFLNPATVHFEQGEFLFSRFVSEILIHRPAISHFKNDWSRSRKRFKDLRI